MAVLWKLGCIWPTLQESVTAVSLIRRHHWCWQFVCLTDCSHCLESSPVTDTNSLYYIHVAHGFVLLQCFQTAATISKAHLHSRLSGLPTLKYFIFVLTRNPGDTHIVSKISLLKMCFIYARICKNGPSRKTPAQTSVRSGAEVITFWSVALLSENITNLAFLWK